MKAEFSRKVTPLKAIQKISIFYDGDCPLCSNYARYQELTQVAGEVELRNFFVEKESFIPGPPETARDVRRKNRETH